MSIYSTSWSTDATDHDPDCAVWVPVAEADESDMASFDGRYWRRDPTRTCSCRCGPIAYQGSHVLPSDGDERAGSVDVSRIDGHISRTGRPALGDDAVWPWVRLGANDGKGGDVVVLLDRKQATEIRDAVSDALEYMPEPEQEAAMADLTTHGGTMTTDFDYYSEATPPFAHWAIVELMGHRRLAGFLTEQEIAGKGFLRLDIPCDPPATQMYNPSSVYAITPTTEAVARAVAVSARPAPVQRWELAAPRPVGDDEGPF